MFPAEKTVKNYVSALFAKLGMERRTQAARTRSASSATSTNTTAASLFSLPARRRPGRGRPRRAAFAFRLGERATWRLLAAPGRLEPGSFGSPVSVTDLQAGRTPLRSCSGPVSLPRAP
jgi:hypothetical protein